MGERERDVFYNNSFFRRLLLPREKKKRERREREREKEEKRKEKQERARLVRMRTAKHFLRASAWLHRERERPDAFDFSAETFLVFFSRLLCVFPLLLCVSFLLQERRKRRRRHRRRKPIPSILRRQEQHRYYTGAFARLKPSSPTRTVSLGTFFKI